MGVTKKKTIGGPERAKKLSPAESKIKKSPLLKGAGAEAERKKRVAQTTVKSRGRQLGSKTEKPSASPKKKIIPTSPVTNPNTPINKSSETKPTQKVALKSGRATRTKASKKEDPLTERTVQKSKKVVEASKSNDEPEMNKLSPKAKGKKVLSLKNQKSTPVKKKKKRHARTHLKKAIEQNRGVVYFSHLPHGFYEKELRKYCAQFGVVTGVYLPRSENGNSKGYAFVEFAHPEVAGVVAETMNNYLMMNRLIKAKLVPIEQQKPWLFGNGVQPAKVAQKRKRDALEARERTLTPEEETAYKKRSEQKVKRLKSKLEKKGLSYDFTVVT